MILLLSANSWWILGYRKFSIKFPREACLFQAHLRESLIETGWGGGGGFFNLEKAMVSVLQKELGNKGEKLKYKKVGGHAADDQNQIRTSSW